MTDHARVVIIGGGAVGCSALYHLALMGWTECLLLERAELTSGSTWHAAGNCPTFSTSWNVLKLQRYGNELYARLAAEADPPLTWHPTGSIRLAHGRDRMDEFRHVCAMARAQGLGLALVTPKEARELYPFLELDDLEGALFDPYDGDVDPSQLTQAFARRAREQGCEIRRFTNVTGLEPCADGTWRVRTDRGEIACEIVVNAAGYRAGEIMAMVGQRLPIVAMSHQYLVTESIPELEARPAKLPLLRDPDVSYYLRQERAGLLLGPYEWEARPHWLDGIPGEFANQLFADDLDRLEPYIEAAIARVPILGSGGVQRVINGPIPYSPDGNPYIGPAHGLQNFYQCCCFSFGIVQAGGAGKALAEWVVHGAPEWDLWPFDPRRYTGYATRSYAVARAVELYQREYAIAYPFEERPAGRPARTSPLYDRLRAKGARFGARGGWERATWFARADAPAAERLSFRRAETALVRGRGRGMPGGRPRAWASSISAASPSSWSRGRAPRAFLDRLVCSRLPRVGRIALAYALNEQGGIVSEFTITRLGPERFYLASAAAAEWHDDDLLRIGSAGRRLGPPRGPLGAARHAGRGRPAGARRAGPGDHGRPCGRGLALAVGAHDRDRPGRGDAAARELRGRARLRAARSGRDAGAGLRGAVRGRRRARHPRLRHPRSRKPPAREGLSGLEDGPDPRIDAADGGPRSLRRPRKGRLRRPRGPAPAEGGGPARAPGAADPGSTRTRPTRPPAHRC